MLFFFIIEALLQPESSEAMQDFIVVTLICVNCRVLTVRKLQRSIRWHSSKS